MSNYEAGITRPKIIGELNKSVHGKLEEYVPVITEACQYDPEFVARLIAWDFTNGQIKDSKVALPVISLGYPGFHAELLDNSLAHLAMQPPRELLKALQFSIKNRTKASKQKALESMIHRYLAAKESIPAKWHRLAARHRRSLKTLYALTHYKAPEWVGDILFKGKYAPGSIFHDIKNLHRLPEAQAAAVIEKWHLSPLVVSGAMAGSLAKQDSSAITNAVMNQMSDTEVVTKAKSLERRGVAKDQALKETFRKKVAKATKSGKATLKTGVAADEVEDESMKTMLKELQERQIQSQKDAGRGIDGNWLVISDRSASQEVSIELGVHIAAIIAKFVTGRVWLVFCNTEAIPYEVTGMSLEDIKGKTKFIIANGGTSYGVGLEWALSKGLDLDGVAIVGDGAENSVPIFANSLGNYKAKFGKQLPTYIYKTAQSGKYLNDSPLQFSRHMASIPYTEHDLTHGNVDYYSLPNLVQSMNANSFGVVEKVMACPLLQLDTVLPKLQKGVKVHA